PAAAQTARAAPSRAAGGDAGEQVWERAHLEQMMFALARDHAEAAARCARATPPDREGEQTHSLVSLLMSFLALEAFINMVGGDRLGSRYRHYDRMSPEGKWQEVTRLVSKTGRTFAEDGKDLRALSTLRIGRNLPPDAPQAGGGRGGRPPAERSGDRQGGREERGAPAAPRSPGPAPAPAAGQGPVRPRRRRRR